MKKIILTAAIALTFFGFSTTTFAATGTTTNTVLPTISQIGEIEVHGNVQVYLTSGSEDKVTVYDNYYASGALVQEENKVLRITSYDSQKLVVWVTVSDLSKLSVYDQASVSSFGKFSGIDVKVNLYDHAQAKLDLDVFDATFAVNDHASAELSGKVENGTVGYDRFAFVDNQNLSATKLTASLNPHPVKHPHHMEFAAI